MKQYYFTFGQAHAHSVNGYTYDKDVVCAIKAENEEEARNTMFEVFGDKWSFSYEEKPNMTFFPRGIKEFN
jgi:hypothetical protein